MTYRADVLANGPVVYYEFEEVAGSTAFDSSPNGHDGTIGADTVLGATGEHALCFTYSPADLFGNVAVTIPDLPTDKILIECWARQESQGGNPRLWEIEHTITDERFGIVTSSIVWFQLKPVGGSSVSLTWNHAGEPTDGDFHLYQFEFDGTDIAIWFDGDKKASTPFGFPTIDWASGNLTIGNKRDDGDDADTWNGQIDDFAIYPIAVADKVTVPPPVPGVPDELYYDQLGLTELATQVAFCPSLTYVDAAFTMVDGGLTATLPAYETGDVLALAYHHSTGVLSGWTQLDNAGSNLFVIAVRIADGSEGTDLTLPSGNGFPAAIASWRPFPTVDDTILNIISAPFSGGTTGLTGFETDSTSGGDTPGTFPVLAFSQLVSGDGELDTMSIAIVLTDGTWPDYTWNHEIERARWLDVASGYAVIVADGMHDDSTTSILAPDAPSITWGVSTSSIFHGAVHYVCTLAPEGGGGSECAVDDFGDLINDDFADALPLSVFFDSSFSFSGGFPPLHSPLDGETTVAATKEVGEPDHNGNTGGHSIWFSFVPTDTGVFQILASGNGSDSEGKMILLAAYTGASVGALSEITYDVTPPAPEDGFGSMNDCEEIIPFTYFEATLTSGTTYYIAVDVGDGETVNAVRLQGGLI